MPATVRGADARGKGPTCPISAANTFRLAAVYRDGLGRHSAARPTTPATMQSVRTTRLAVDCAAGWWLPVQIQPDVATPISTRMKTEIAIRTTFTGYLESFDRILFWLARI